ncbi:putative secreted lipase [Cladobotryum mycophilum]|uniref:Secreted lipase n=1 Tax=Cladobotryum mycophilum TaxID=491253 RepID=A0ABR0STX0_9HYPO
MLLHFVGTITAISALLGFAFATSDAAARDNSGSSIATSHEAAAIRSFFYAGGGYADDGYGGHILREQMYVERLQPANGVKQTTPIVLIHGQAQTGTNFLNKPDGGTGWASQFIRQGYEVYIVDQSLRGRSPWQPGQGAVQPSTYSAEIIEQRFTAIRNFNLWPQASLHSQWPGNGSMGDVIFDTFYSSNVQFISNATYQQSTVQNAGASLLDRIGKPVVLIGHSQGGIMPILIADARPNLAKALILLEPSGPPFREAIFSTTPARAWGLTDIKLTYSPPVTDPAVDLKQQMYPAGKPILLVTSEASYHAPYDYCTEKYLQQAGCSKTEHLQLANAGIHGNGHMFFMEKNSDQIQQKLEDWIDNL